MPDWSLDSEVQFLKGVGPRLAPAFAKLELRTVRDVLDHFPRRYEDRRNLPPIKELTPGSMATIRGKLARVESRPTRGGMVILKVTIRDQSGSCVLVWFNQPWVKRALENYGGEIIAYGMVKEGEWIPEIHAPEWEKLDDDADPEDFARIVPVYPLTEGVSQKSVRKAARDAVDRYLHLVPEALPEWVRKEQKLRPIQWAYRQIHQPDEESFRMQARERLVFDEFLSLQLAYAMRRYEIQLDAGIAYPIDALVAGSSVEVVETYDDRLGAAGRRPSSRTLFTDAAEAKRGREPLWDQIHRMLPFELTGAQRKVIGEIFADMKRPHPMNRLVQGDVGSGKTAVAACAALAAVRSGYQVAMMAPTEILAEQHAANLRRLFAPLEIEVELLVGKLSASAKKKAAERTTLGLVPIAVGTHALIQEGVQFANLGLAIIDEQHRFGVEQRLALRQKGLGNPDVLVMTATPIPRTLTMTHYGDLETSVIDELPPGRRPIKTHHRLPARRSEVYEAVRGLLEQGRQAYFVCPMVSENEKMQAQAATELFERLKTTVFPTHRVGLLHGQMKPAEKDNVMAQFRAHELDILVSTTVIEVGVDVQNASVMVIEDANRFGLSQLHQLRGRVGRGQFQSYCILIADAKTDDAVQRMAIMVETNDGFRIAEEDLRLRGHGEVAGTKQSGNFDFRIADLVNDHRLLKEAREIAIRLVEGDPQLEADEHRHLRERVRERWSGVALITVS